MTGSARAMAIVAPSLPPSLLTTTVVNSCCAWNGDEFIWLLTSQLVLALRYPASVLNVRVTADYHLSQHHSPSFNVVNSFWLSYTGSLMDSNQQIVWKFTALMLPPTFIAYLIGYAAYCLLFVALSPLAIHLKASVLVTIFVFFNSSKTGGNFHSIQHERFAVYSGPISKIPWRIWQ